EVEERIEEAKEITQTSISSSEGRFYSPLVKNIAATEGISQSELDSIKGSGKEGRVTKNDILKYVENRSSGAAGPVADKATAPTAEPVNQAPVVPVSGEDEIIEMTRMGKLISAHMVQSVQTSAHVQSFVECDVTNIWNWRNK